MTSRLYFGIHATRQARSRPVHAKLLPAIRYPCATWIRNPDRRESIKRRGILLRHGEAGCLDHRLSLWFSPMNNVMPTYLVIVQGYRMG